LIDTIRASFSQCEPEAFFSIGLAQTGPLE
jgi:hypothetical protein